MKTKLIYFLPLILFFACNNSEKQVSETKKEAVEKTEADYIKEGKTIAETTFKVLSSNLQEAMVDGGIENA